MKNIIQILLVSILILFSSCISQFLPKTTEDRELLVVTGLITDKPVAYTIKLSRPQHLGGMNIARPIGGCIVQVSDDSGQSFSFNETNPGTYVSNPAVFQGIVGHSYTLHISTDVLNGNLNYQSYPTELKPVPPIDNVYYQKVIFVESTSTSGGQEGCQVYLDTHDPENICKFYRWEYSETWEFHLPYIVPNSICWLSNNSNVINIKNTSTLETNKIEGYPLNLVSNLSDRLSIKYSILVNQYSLNEDEYLYWEKLQNITEEVGGLYDMIPSSIPSNIYCIDNPNEQVLGYFSVSANSSKRLFIKDNFAGVITPYTSQVCIADTVFGPSNGPIRDLGTYAWVIIDHPLPPPSYRVITRVRGCYDCTVRGSNIQPDYWNEGK